MTDFWSANSLYNTPQGNLVCHPNFHIKPSLISTEQIIIADKEQPNDNTAITFLGTQNSGTELVWLDSLLNSHVLATAGAPNVVNLDDLLDVDVLFSNLTNGEALAYDAPTTTWKHSKVSNNSIVMTNTNVALTGVNKIRLSISSVDFNQASSLDTNYIASWFTTIKANRHRIVITSRYGDDFFEFTPSADPIDLTGGNWRIPFEPFGDSDLSGNITPFSEDEQVVVSFHYVGDVRNDTNTNTILMKYSTVTTVLPINAVNINDLGASTTIKLSQATIPNAVLNPTTYEQFITKKLIPYKTRVTIQAVHNPEKFYDFSLTSTPTYYALGYYWNIAVNHTNDNRTINGTFLDGEKVFVKFSYVTEPSSFHITPRVVHACTLTNPITAINVYEPVKFDTLPKILLPVFSGTYAINIKLATILNVVETNRLLKLQLIVVNSEIVQQKLFTFRLHSDATGNIIQDLSIPQITFPGNQASTAELTISMVLIAHTGYLTPTINSFNLETNSEITVLEIL